MDTEKLKVLLTDFLGKEKEGETSTIESLEDKLPEISDMDELISYWGSVASGSRPAELIEARMAKILEDELPKISDMDELISYWKGVASGSRPEEFIEVRMAKILKEVSLHNVPKWFETFLAGASVVPEFLKDGLMEKSKQLLNDLSK
jgi:hypothetical protein